MPSTNLVPVTTSCASAERPPTSTDRLIAEAVAACAAVTAADLRVRQPAIQKLRAVREAGRLLSLVQRQAGGRPPKNSSRAVTSFQTVLTEAGITRKTAHRWRRVAEVAPEAFERFLVEAPLAGRDLTIAELLRACRARADRTTVGRTVKLTLSATEYEAFQQYVDVLTPVYDTDTVTHTVLAVLQHAYTGWMAAQNRFTVHQPTKPETSDAGALPDGASNPATALTLARAQ